MPDTAAGSGGPSPGSDVHPVRTTTGPFPCDTMGASGARGDGRRPPWGHHSAQRGTDHDRPEGPGATSRSTSRPPSSATSRGSSRGHDRDAGRRGDPRRAVRRSGGRRRRLTSALRDAEVNQELNIDGVLVADADADGKIHVRKLTDHHTRRGTKWGVVGGAALAIIFPPSLIVGAVAGGAIGAILGKDGKRDRQEQGRRRSSPASSRPARRASSRSWTSRPSSRSRRRSPRRPRSRRSRSTRRPRKR